MGSPAEMFLQLSVAASINGIWPRPFDDPGPVSILKECSNGQVGIGLNAARNILIENTTVSGSCAVPDGYYQGPRAELTMALSSVFTNRMINIRPDKAEFAAVLPPEATSTFAHASNLGLIEDCSPDAKAWKQTLIFESGPNIDVVERARFDNLNKLNSLLFALYPAYTHLNSLDGDGYYSLYRHEGRITILKYQNFENTTHGGTNFIVIPRGIDEHNEHSSGRARSVRPLLHNVHGEPGFFPNPDFYDYPSVLEITSSDPGRRLKWFAHELRTQTRKPQSHIVDFGSHHLETLRCSPDQINPNDAARITADVFNALFQNYDFTSDLLKSLGLWGTVFAQNDSRLVRQSLAFAENSYFRDTTQHPGVFSGLSSPLFADLMAIALPIPLEQYVNRPASSDKVISTSIISRRSPRSLWSDQQFTIAKNALEKTKRIAIAQSNTSAVNSLQHDIAYFEKELSKSSWN